MIKVRCRKCNLLTDCIQDCFSIRKNATNSFNIYCKCSVCRGAKSKKLTLSDIKLLPLSVQNGENKTYQSSDLVIDEKSGGLLPLAVLIPIVGAIITALSSTAGVVGNTIIEKQKANEIERHNREIEKSVSGGIIDEVIDDELRYMIELFRGKGFEFL
mgnify:CR=1 FL=1